MADVVLYHNPRCSKSRGALGLLEERGITPTVVDYLKSPPDAKTLKQVLKALGLGARELLRKDETEYAELGLDDPALGEAELIAAMCAHPRLIQRPIVIVGTRAVVARPPERLLELLP